MRLLRPQDRLILTGRMGSYAYGLATPTSDIDLLGVYMAPNEDFLGLSLITEKDLTAHETGEELDYTYHELSKFCRSALTANPTILEFLFIDEYRKETYEGRTLVNNRHHFLSSKARGSFGGYAMEQAKKLEARQEEGKVGYDSNLKNRFAKHTRHCFRLLRQGAHLLQTGELKVKVDNPQELFDLGESPPDVVIAKFKEEYEKFKQVESVLPDEPNVEAINEMVLWLRQPPKRLY